MKNTTILFIILFGAINVNAQSEWSKGANGLLAYEYPSDWSESELLKTETNISYGAKHFDLGEIIDLSIMEIPNATGIVDATTIGVEDIKNLVLNIFSPSSEFYEIKNSSIANIKSKYVDASAITSQNSIVHTKLHLIFLNNKMIIIQVNFTNKEQKDYSSLAENIFRRISTR